MPEDLDYPEPLKPFLHRKIASSVLGSSAGYFVKPLKTKAFEAQILPDRAEDALTRLHTLGLSPETPCWRANPMQFQHEWRIYILKGDVIGAAQYDQGHADAELTTQEWCRVRDMVKAWSEAPSAYALDVGRLASGELALVEVNDAWGTGFYSYGTLSAKGYADWLAQRWQELQKRARA